MFFRRSMEEELKVKELESQEKECFWNWLECTEKALSDALKLKKGKKSSSF